MHNLSMVHHAAGREDEAIKLQREIAEIGEEMGMTDEEKNEASDAAGGPASGPAGDASSGSPPVKLRDTREGGKGKNRRKKKNKQKAEGEEEGDAATTWKPTNTRNVDGRARRSD